MILKLFKSNTVFSALVSLGLLILFWAKSFGLPESYSLLNVGVLYHFESQLIAYPSWLLLSISMLIILITASILNITVNQNGFFDKNTFLPFTLYVLLVSALMNFNNFNSIIIANLFLVLFLRWSFKIRRQEDARQLMFNGSFLLSLSTLFFPYYAPLLLSPFILLVVFRPFIWREWFLSGLGLLIPAVFYAYLMYFLNFPFENNTYNHSFWELFNFSFSFGINHYLLIIIYSLLTVFSVYVIYKRLNFGSLRLRTLFRFLGYNSVVVFFLSFGLYFISDVFLIVIALPLAIIFSYYFYHTKSFFGDLNFYLLLAIITYSIYLV